MGTNCNQQGYISIRLDHLCKLTGLSTNTARSALKELISYGCMRILIKQKGHKPPIYEINRSYINKGVRNNIDNFDYSQTNRENLLTNVDQDYIPVEKKVKYADGDTTIFYNEVLAEQKKESSAATEDS